MTLLGRTEPRLFTKPLQRLTPETSRGFAFNAWCEDELGWQPTDWQKWLSIHALEVMPTDPSRYRYRTVVILVGRRPSMRQKPVVGGAGELADAA